MLRVEGTLCPKEVRAMVSQTMMAGRSLGGYPRASVVLLRAALGLFALALLWPGQRTAIDRRTGRVAWR